MPHSPARARRLGAGRQFGLRRYLRRTPSATGKPGLAFEIDPGKLAEEARYDGLFVLSTNAQVTPLQALLRYLRSAPAVRSKRRCRMHGGAAGSGAPIGNKNALRHGHYTAEAIAERRALAALIQLSRATLADLDKQE